MLTASGLLNQCNLRNLWIVPSRFLSKINRASIAAANHDADSLASCRLVPTGDQRSKRRCSARLRSNSHFLPKYPLGFLNCFVSDEHRLIDITLREREHQFTDAAWRQRISSYATGFSIDRTSSFERFVERRGFFRFDRYQLQLISIPRGDATDKPAATNGNQQGIQIW